MSKKTPNTKVVTVLDFMQGEIHVYTYLPKVLQEEYSDDIEEFIEAKGHSISSCQWLCTDTLSLTVHNT